MKSLLSLRVVSAALVCAAIFLGWRWYSSGDNFENLYRLEIQPLERLVAFSGTTVAQQSVDLAFEVSGRVTAVNADVGERVERGAVLARLENAGVEASLQRERAALEAEEARLAALVRGTRPEEIAVVNAELNRARDAFSESERALSSAIASAYAAADTAIYKTADLLFSQPKTLPRLLYESSDSGSKPALESQRQDIELLLNSWRAEVRGVVGALPIERFSFAVRLVAATAAAANTNSFLDAALHSRNNLVTIANFFNRLIDYARDLIPGGSLSQASIDSYVSLLTQERTAVLAELSSLTTAVKSYTDSERAKELAEASLALSEAGASAEEVAEARAKVAAQKARVAELQSTLEKYYIRAPFSGIIVERNIEPGELGTAAQSVISLDGEGAVEIEARVSELDVISLKEDDIAEVTFDAYEDREPVKARVVAVDPTETVENGESGYGVTLAFESKDETIRPGMTVNVLIVKREREATLSVPQQYIRRDGARAFVQIVRDNHLEESEVTLGISIPGFLVELVHGVAPGDMLAPYESH